MTRLVLGFAAFFAMSVALAGDSSILGKWNFPQEFDMGFMKISMQLEFTADQITTHARCTATDGRSAVASVTVPVTISATTIKILETKAVSQNQNGIECNASTEQGEMNYHLDGNTLHLSQQGQPETLTLTRAQQ